MLSPVFLQSMATGRYGLNGVVVIRVVVWDTSIDGVGVPTRHHSLVVKIARVMPLNLSHATISHVQVREKSLIFFTVYI